MELQVKALFTHDKDNMLRNINEFKGTAAPRLFYGRTVEGSVLRFRYDLPDIIKEGINKIIAEEPIHEYLPNSPMCLEKLKEVLQQHAEIQYIWEGPAYELPNKLISSIDIIRVTETNADILKNSFQSLIPRVPYSEPCFIKVVRGNVAAVAFSSRVSEGACEVGIETLPSFRGKGYAVELVEAWAAKVREIGKIPLYSTAWNNKASQAVARKLKAIFYGVDLSIY
jgi:GNAT superfamily N-acetyltransferase